MRRGGNRMKTLANARDRIALLERLATIRPDSARRWGTMSAHEMVCHLGDGFRMVIGHKAVSPATSPLQRTIVKWIALYAPLPWPAGILTRPEIEQGVGGTCPGDFARDVADLVSLLDAFATTPHDFTWPPHPIFGPLTGKAWLRWGYLHMDHHLRQFGA
jgi:Protein of unknown function (DUF1569)